ncbi:hypothetical protein NEF87_001774 [Candidatus Lokiarchaeum ossiferum]|uniref:Uncharacterized protein n=1 Tax=Candidatus Lokiarchaeum ossiferum TaxID=2951803 RepID=A0ABY6HPP7_9ARCH|nr:hypothetical protein NEF87_001774 [Candidatus Lokiarchaeum sp. B-35]
MSKKKGVTKEPKQGRDLQKSEHLRKNPHQKMPSNLEAVYENGVFIGRKVKAPLASDYAQTPVEYLSLIHDVEKPLETRNDAILHYLMFFQEEFDAFFASPQEEILNVIKYQNAEKLSFLISQLSEITDKRVSNFRKKCCTILKKHPRVEPWMLENI